MFSVLSRMNWNPSFVVLGFPEKLTGPVQKVSPVAI